MQADASSEAVFIEQHDQAFNHQGSALRFGPDGYLYISLGDEGGQNDQYENGQNITKNFFSGILRIDVNRRSGSLEPNPHPAIPLHQGKARYAVPADNPFVHQRQGGSWDGMLNGVNITALEKVRTEFWAIGMRNPWQMHFDPKTGELWVGDVGGGSWEEVFVVTRGGNYGWPYREGMNSGPKKPTQAESGFEGLPPLHAYPHGSGTGQGNSITGGLVYRGTRFPELAGTYLFADYASGNLWALRRRDGQPPHVARLTGKTSKEVEAALKKYESDRVILGYRAVLDPDRIGHGGVRAVEEGGPLTTGGDLRREGAEVGGEQPAVERLEGGAGRRSSGEQRGLAHARSTIRSAGPGVGGAAPRGGHPPAW
jgi:glucose/arabinose dehydrogenase